MLKTVIGKIIGDRHAREARRMQPLVDEINGIADELAQLPEQELQAQTEKLRALVRERTGQLEAELAALREKKRHTESADERNEIGLDMRRVEDDLKTATQEVLDDILPEAYATVKEACRRNMGRDIVVTGQPMKWDMIPYDVQLIGGVQLHRGRVAEMATGEGKTLVATMPLYLNALSGRGVHLVTVNPYLAQRDSEWMGTIYKYLGLNVDCIDLHEPGSPERRQAYFADITYGTNNEFGFDYLRDNMVHSLEQRVQRPHYYAIIDEVDSILIDEARTPLIISGPVGEEESDIYRRYNPMVASLFRSQTRLTNELIAQAERDLENNDEEAAGIKLLAAKRGAPRNKRLLKLFADQPARQKLVNTTEANFMRDKRLQDIDEMVYFAMDEKGHSTHLSDMGLEELSPGDPQAFVVPDLSEDVGQIERDLDLGVDEKRDRIQALEHEYAEKSGKIQAIHQLLKAYSLYNKDEQYIVEDGEVIIVDEFTGRKMVGRRWSDGLHQAVEAKEGVVVRGETQTLATITIQNYFRMYDKLAGMTGTAETEEGEFHQIYNLDVAVIPTNRPVIRDDRHDLVYRTKREKYNAIMDEIERLHKLELPVLAGTVSVDISETLSRMLKRRGIPHNVLNAKYHKQEAEIVAGAGQPGAVTIATNMAGRGTDIKLGPGVTDARTVGWLRAKGMSLDDLPQSADPARAAELENADDDTLIDLGGLHIIGSERHESRRIDRQLRGRAGRQGDPGASQFFLSLEDDLMRLFGSERIAGIMQRLGAQEGEVITHPLVTRSIGKAQQRVEVQNFEARKRLLDYDDVMNQQREVIYDRRLFALEGGEDLKGEVWELIEQAVNETVDEYIPEGEHPENWDLAGLRHHLAVDNFLVVMDLPQTNTGEHDFAEREHVRQLVLERARQGFDAKLKELGDNAEHILSWILLTVIDDKWRDHLYELDHLKASIGFRGWGQKDPLIEYKQDAYTMFVELMKDIRKSVASIVFRARLIIEAPPPPPRQMFLSGPSDAPETGDYGAQPLPEPIEEDEGELLHAAVSPLAARRAALAAEAERMAAPNPEAARRAALAAGLTGAQETDVSRLRTSHGEDGGAGGPAKKQPVHAAREKQVGRNDPCWCGSGKKYKKCHGAGQP